MAWELVFPTLQVSSAEVLSEEPPNMQQTGCLLVVHICSENGTGNSPRNSEVVHYGLAGHSPKSGPQAQMGPGVECRTLIL